MKNKRSEIVEKNIGLVKSCISKFSYQKTDYDDIFQAGCLGLIKASMKFDENRGTKFSSYAVPYIFGEIKNFFSENSKIKISKIIKKNYNSIKSEEENFINTYKREPTLKEISEILNLSIEDIVQALESVQFVSSVDDDNEKGFCSFEESHEDLVSEKIDIEKAIKSLNEKDQKIINMRFFEQKTQSYLAKILGMTQVQVSRREKKIIEYLRSKLS